MGTEPVIRQTQLWFGGDYNPEQWPESVRAADLAAMEQLGVNAVTLGVFAWARLHPAKGTFDVGWLERIVDEVAERGIGVVLATPTAAQPAWMSAAYPEILPVDAFGNRRRHGGRVNYCPSATAYREASAEIAGVLADRFGRHDAVVLWHVNNEYGPVCYCELCREGFRRWLAERYGDLPTLNESWGTNVWGNTLYDWSEVELPSGLNAIAPSAPDRVRFAPNPSIALDHARFCSAVLLECYLNEKAVLRDRSPEVPVTTNFHGPVQVVDWHEWAPHVDVVAWDSYPPAGAHWAAAAFGHDLARGAGSRQDFVVMESSPGPVNWHDRCALKRPGQLRLEALQAVARGARGVLYFQVRQSRSGAELNHAAMIPRHGRLDTRTGAELVDLGAELSAIAVLHDSHHLVARVALVFDWASWWAHGNTPGLDQRSRYLDTVRDAHRALTERGHVVDVVAAAGPFDGYDVVVAPLLHLVERRTIDSLTEYISIGGTLVTTTGSAIVDGSGRVDLDGVDPAWRRLVGLWVEETDVQPPDVVNRVVFLDDGTTAEGRELFDIVRPEAAETVATFRDDFYAGSPAVTVNSFGSGRAYYVACLSDRLVALVVGRHVAASDALPDVERLRWQSTDGDVEFVLDHRTADTTVQRSAR